MCLRKRRLPSSPRRTRRLGRFVRGKDARCKRADVQRLRLYLWASFPDGRLLPKHCMAFVKISTEYKDPFGYLESGRNELALSDRCEAGQAWPTYLERPIVFLRTDGGREADASEEYANQRRRRVLLPVTVLPTPSTFPAQAQPAASCCRCRPPGDPKVPRPPVSQIPCIH